MCFFYEPSDLTHFKNVHCASLTVRLTEYLPYVTTVVYIINILMCLQKIVFEEPMFYTENVQQGLYNENT